MRYAIALGVILSATCAGAQDGPLPSHDDRLDTIIDAVQHNLESVGALTFTVESYGVSGTLNRGTRRLTDRYAYIDRALFSHRADGALFLAGGSGTPTLSPFSSHGFHAGSIATDNVRRLYRTGYGAISGDLNEPGSEWFRPLDIAYSSKAWRLFGANVSGLSLVEWLTERETEWNGTEVVGPYECDVVETYFRLPGDGEKLRSYRWYVCEQLNFAVVRQESLTEGALESIETALEFSEASDGVWFPIAGESSSPLGKTLFGHDSHSIYRITNFRPGIALPDEYFEFDPTASEPEFDVRRIEQTLGLSPAPTEAPPKPRPKPAPPPPPPPMPVTTRAMDVAKAWAPHLAAGVAALALLLAFALRQFQLE